MLNIKSLLVILLSTLIITATPQGNKQPRKDEDYKRTTLKDLIDAPIKEIEPASGNDTRVTGDIRPSKVTVKYAGRVQASPQDKTDLINQWAQRFAGSPDFYTRPYQKEAVFTEDGTEHWLFIREESVSLFENELKKGDSLELSVIRLGATRIEQIWTPVILVEKISKR
jgi:hypothetical protein